MILCPIADFHRYAALHPRFALVLDALKGDLNALPEGRTTLDGDDAFVIASPNAATRPEPPLEAHQAYIDIQVILKGVDTMGWAKRESLTPTAPFDAAKDIVFFREPSFTRVAVPAGHLAAFFPEDAHAPLIGDGEAVHKLVFKLRA